jgi:hypothetical protein
MGNTLRKPDVSGEWFSIRCENDLLPGSPYRFTDKTFDLLF